MQTTLLPLGLALLTLVAARTDLSGCTSSTAGPSLIWYVPGTGELCDLLDCGGGRAPPKTTVPGCAGYVGTATYSPSYLSGFGAAPSTSAAVSAETTSAAGGGLSSGSSPSALPGTTPTLLPSPPSSQSAAVTSEPAAATASGPGSPVMLTATGVSMGSQASNYSASASTAVPSSTPSSVVAGDAASAPAGAGLSTVTSTAIATATAGSPPPATGSGTASRSGTPLGASPTITGAGSTMVVPGLVGVVAAGLALVL